MEFYLFIHSIISLHQLDLSSSHIAFVWIFCKRLFFSRIYCLTCQKTTPKNTLLHVLIKGEKRSRTNGREEELQSSSMA